jgi:hypothetical protein
MLIEKEEHGRVCRIRMTSVEVVKIGKGWRGVSP